MLPAELRALFWDVNLDTFDPLAYPEYTIARILEFGDEASVAWMRGTFAETQIIDVIRRDRRLSAKSANYWRLVYHIPAEG